MYVYVPRSPVCIYGRQRTESSSQTSSVLYIRCTRQMDSVAAVCLDHREPDNHTHTRTHTHSFISGCDALMNCHQTVLPTILRTRIEIKISLLG